MKTIYKCMSVMIICLVVLSCKKDNSSLKNTKELTTADSGSAVSVTMGQRIVLTIGNPGDGGYRFNNPQYDDSILTLINHAESVGVHPGTIGDFGRDVWTFTAKGSGTTALKITATRTASETVSMFNSNIIVK